MLPAQPPKSRRKAGTRNDTLRMCKLVGQDLLGKPALKAHDGVEGQRATNDG
jgi:hypothetical protein